MLSSLCVQMQVVPLQRGERQEDQDEAGGQQQAGRGGGEAAPGVPANAQRTDQPQHFIQEELMAELYYDIYHAAETGSGGKLRYHARRIL
jgi:hypothetical protein